MSEQHTTEERHTTEGTGPAPAPDGQGATAGATGGPTDDAGPATHLDGAFPDGPTDTVPTPSGDPVITDTGGPLPDALTGGPVPAAGTGTTGTPLADAAVPAAEPAPAADPSGADSSGADSSAATTNGIPAAEVVAAEVPVTPTTPGSSTPAARPAPPRPGPPRPGPPRPAPPAGGPRPDAPRRSRETTTATPAVPVAQPSPVASASADPARWGRVDDDGTIHLRTADGERVVGSWQAGAPQEGLAHFARRFDDVLTEVELLAARLSAGGGDPKQALTAARGMRAGLDDASFVGDVAGLSARLDDVIGMAEQSVAEARSARDAQRAAAVARKEELVTEAETLAAEATHWKQAGDRFTAILDEWRTIRGIDRKADELLWKRFSKAREAFNRRRGSHFADLDRQRSSARGRKEELAVEAEKLAGSEDWGPTAARFRDLMVEWKAAGRAQKDTDDTLWQRFRTAQDTFFARRAETFAERDAEFVANAEAKKALLTEAERIDIADPAAARAALRTLQERWEEIGKVPRDDIRPLEARMRTVEEKVREAGDRQWRRTDPEAEARVAQFRDRVAQFEAQAQKAEAAGDKRRAERAASQAAQWREWLATAEQAVQHR